jgi:hypothetical protein
MDVETDIDINFLDPAHALSGLRCVRGVQINKKGQREEHISAVYFQDIPVDPLDGRAAWDYETAAEKGFFKLDFLKSTTYEGVRDEAHLLELMQRPPPWDRFVDQTMVARLNQISRHFHVMVLIEPQNLNELAVCLALILPEKSYLQRRPRFEILRDIWKPSPGNGYMFKKSHSVAYAVAAIVQLNCLVEQGF